jgi:hypothetical protein
MERRPDIGEDAERRRFGHSAIERRLPMTESVIHEVEDWAGLREIGPMPEKVDEGFTPSSRPVVHLPMKRRGPIIAGGIIRFDVGARRSNES